MKYRNLVCKIVVIGVLLSFLTTVTPQTAKTETMTAAERDRVYPISYSETPGDGDELYTDPAPDPPSKIRPLAEMIDPEDCGVPLQGPFGQDVEIMIAPDSGHDAYQLSLKPSWQIPQDLMGEARADDITATSMGTEHIVAVVKETDAMYYTIWNAHEGFSEPHDLGASPDGNPALLSRNAYNWVVFARYGDEIKFREWNYGVLGEWTSLDGVSGDAGAASDPVAISISSDHMMVFYTDIGGRVWFTEAILGGGGVSSSSMNSAEVAATIWRDEPVSLSDLAFDNFVYLPFTFLSFSGTFAASPSDQAPKSAQMPYTAFSLASEMSAIARDENHVAVFGVDMYGQLWVKEWTHLNESDWSDTHWTKLMDDVMVERPSVTSRHINHLGVAVRKNSGEPYYIEWSYASGWKTPVSLTGIRSNPLTIAATGVDNLSVFSVENNKVVHKNWNETEEWGHWGTLIDRYAQNGQHLTAVTRQLDDLMLFSIGSLDMGWYSHFTALGQNFVESEIYPEEDFRTIHGTNALAWVDGDTYLVGGEPQSSHWNITGMSLVSGVTETLALPEHQIHFSTDLSAVASGDLDSDGDDEVVFVSALPDASVLDISVLDLATTPVFTITHPYYDIYTTTQNIKTKVDVAIGDLDNDGRQDEVAIVYEGETGLYVAVFEYITSTHTLEYQGEKVISVSPKTGFSRWDLLVDIARVYARHPSYGMLPADQLIVSVAYMDFTVLFSYVHTEVYSMTASTPNWTFVNLDSFDSAVEEDLTDVPGMATGDLDADGLSEIAYAYATRLDVIDFAPDSGSRTEIAYKPKAPDGEYRDRPGYVTNLAMGDVDRDGKAEIAYWTADDRVAILDLVDETTLHQSSSITPSVSDGELLIGDLDGDSFQSDLVGCSDFTEVSVIAVLNGAPRCYASGQTAQETAVRYAKSSTGGSSDALGTTTNVGGFMSVGFEVEINAPLIGTKLGEVRGSVTQDFMTTNGQTDVREESVTNLTGYNVENEQTLGMVVYNGTDYRCYYYDIFSPAQPAETSRLMLCTPVGNAYEDFYTLEHWHSAGFKQQAGASWVDVGHRTESGTRTNDVRSYPSTMPVDPYLLKYTRALSYTVNYDSGGGAYIEWNIIDMQGAAQENDFSFETNTTTSAGVTAGNVTMDAGLTVGFGWDTSRSVSWSDELEIGGTIHKISDPTFETCRYWVVPYIYHAKATTLAGITYPYLEMDYYVPSIEGYCGTP